MPPTHRVRPAPLFMDLPLPKMADPSDPANIEAGPGCPSSVITDTDNLLLSGFNSFSLRIFNAINEIVLLSTMQL